MRKTSTKKITTVDEYLALFPKKTTVLLKQLRAIIKKTAPDSTEILSYHMPAYKYHGRILVYFAGYEHHIGFYPMPAAIIQFKKELSVYKTAKGSIQFPLEKSLPIGLIEKILRFRIKENKLKAIAVSAKK